jgi:AraC-like DNA-binding protein
MKKQHALTGLSASQIRALVPIAEEREQCERRIGELNIQLEKTVSQFRMTGLNGYTPVDLPRPGSVGEQYRAILQAAPAGGLSISEIATKAKKNPATVKSWFYQKNLPTWVNRVARGQYAHK